MSLLRRVTLGSAFLVSGTCTAWIIATGGSKIRDIPSNDAIFQLAKRYNPKSSPVTQDVCLRKVPLNKIRPELLEKEGKLAEAFCAGIWSGIGYAYQRRYLEKKYRSDPATVDHLWDKQDLKSSTYEVGTKITDHFEVVQKTPTAIVVRCGDSPRNQGIRASDGLFEMSAEVKRAEGVVVFGLKSVFYNGLGGVQPDAPGKPAAGPMKPWIQWLHQQYDKLWMETAITNCTSR